MFKIVVLASTRGTDLQAIIDAVKAGELDVSLTAVISNKADCYALERAKDQGFEAIFLDPKNKTPEDYDNELMTILDSKKVDLIVLVGYMRLLTTEFVNHFRGRIINVHPSLLPAFSGKMNLDVHSEVIKSGLKETGMTIHFVNEICDGGPIILQKKIAVEKDETAESLKDKVQALEKIWYPKVIDWIKDGKITVTGNKVIIKN